MRRKYVVDLLPPDAPKHLQDKITSEAFYGPEGAQIEVEFACSMSEKAKDPSEVLEIWKGVLGRKGRIGAMIWPPEKQ